MEPEDLCLSWGHLGGPTIAQEGESVPLGSSRSVGGKISLHSSLPLRTDPLLPGERRALSRLSKSGFSTANPQGMTYKYLFQEWCFFYKLTTPIKVSRAA